MIRIPTITGVIPYIIGGALLFFAGGELIGGYKVSKVMKAQQGVQQQIITNALIQAQELAQKWEEENAKSRALRSKVDQLQGQLRSTSKQLDDASNLRKKELDVAAENLAQCLLNDDTRRILNDWMTDEKPSPPRGS